MEKFPYLGAFEILLVFLWNPPAWEQFVWSGPSAWPLEGGKVTASVL